METNPNWIATIALLSWPLVALVLYATRPVAQATIWTILGANLLLPVGAVLKIPMVPQLDKATIPTVCAFIGCVMAGVRFRVPRFGIVEILILAYVICPLVTSLLNPDPILIGRTFLPGVGLYDGISAVQSALLFMLPFIIGRQIMRTSAAFKEALRALVLAGLFYSIPMLFEIRFSPQLHTWVYGYSPSMFAQSMREDGFRPMVFMGHGLVASFFIMTSVVAAAALYRTRSKVAGLPPGGVTIYLAALLVFCKSLGALIYGATLAPIVRYASAKAQLRIALSLVIISLSYPTLRYLDLFPTDALIQLANSIRTDRAESLEFRFANENQLLSKAFERGLFGWGRYGRNRVYDDVTGDDVSTTDGRWIIVLGQFGLVGFIAEFGLLSLGIFKISRVAKQAIGDERFHIAAIAIILSLNIVELLPNSSISPWTLLLCGALVGKAEALKVTTMRIARQPSRQADLLRSEG